MASPIPSSIKGLVYTGLNTTALQSRPAPTLTTPTDAIVKVTKTTICGTDLHIRKGDVPSCPTGRILGHEGVGVVQATGSSVTRFKPGDHVLISCITSCATCDFCRRGMYSHCRTGGWQLGHAIDGTQATHVRIPHADASLHPVPGGVDEGALVMLSDIFPTGLEVGVLRGKVKPGCSVAIVGAGPVGLAALCAAQMYSPHRTIVVDMDAHRLEVARGMGAEHVISNAGGADAVVKEVLALTEGLGCDTVIEAVGIPATFELCQLLLAPGGTLANVGVHGTKVDLQLQDLWARNIEITAALVDTVSTPMLLKLFQAGKIHPEKMITHRFKFDDIEKAYDTFSAAGTTGALKVLIEMD
ncbi:GroES-like protein [Hypoxylon fragiforme]|uniref:GroES-like protein n=1 Tax=Hypoxylon fragiforme TaxID=63214 RepID=UPI0020C5FE64|nr:GroES-like protein [Hypoxylon fragiforme]KAI2606474.1 GroES-like protein [Hypoxylon fragiforme]